MDIKSLISYCHIQKQKKFETAIALLQKKRYADCLFFCHLALEFAFKEKAVKKTKKPFPITHDLEDLSIKARLSLSKLQRKHLAIINTFNPPSLKLRRTSHWFNSPQLAAEKRVQSLLWGSYHFDYCRALR